MPIPSTPPEILELMTKKVGWESFLGFDGHAEPSYAPLLMVVCWQEEYSVMSGGMTVFRRADGSVVEPQWHLYFAGDDPNARKMQLYDRFTTFAVGDSPEQVLQAVRINTMYGPPFDNKNPWAIEVAL
jgi:hypothetical protein